MKLGTRVRYICEDIWEEEYAGFYPPVGTLGTVERCYDPREDSSLLVQWDSGTKGDGRWWCDLEEVEVVEEEG
jgi:hypothetical protein